MTDATTVATATPAMTAGPTGPDKLKANTMEALAARAPAVSPARAVDRNIQLPPARREGREFQHTEHVITCESNWTLDDVVKPIFWACIWQKLKKWDKVSVQVDDGSWWAEVLVTHVSPGVAFVHVLQFVDFQEKAPTVSAMDGFEIRELGPFRKWCVVRTADKAVLREKCESRRDAEDWLLTHQAMQVKAATAALV